MLLMALLIAPHKLSSPLHLQIPANEFGDGFRFIVLSQVLYLPFLHPEALVEAFFVFKGFFGIPNASAFSVDVGDEVARIGRPVNTESCVCPIRETFSANCFRRLYLFHTHGAKYITARADSWARQMAYGYLRGRNVK